MSAYFSPHRSLCALLVSSFVLSSAIFTPVVSAANKPASDDATPELLSTTGGKGGDSWSTVEEMQKAADAGNPEAGYQLGEMYLNGVQVPVDAAKAVALLERAADAGHANASFRLGKLNADGEVIPKNLPQAFVRYQAAANAGVAEAQYNLGAMYASGRGVKRDQVEGLAWLIVATKSGADADGEKQLRDYLTKQKRTTAIADAEKRAAVLLKETGEAKAAAANGANPGGPAGMSTAPVATRPDGKVKLGETPAPGRIQIAPPALGGLSMPGMPPAPKSTPEPAPESGPPVKLISPIGRPIEWSSLSALERAAEQKQPNALSDLGQVLLAGKLVPADPQRAVQLLERGAAAGSPDAAYQLAEICVTGVHQVKDDAKALTLYRQAALGGSPIAMFNVGAFLANGRGAPRDYTEAFAWVLVAKKYGVQREEIENRLRTQLQKKSPEQIAIAEKRAAVLDQEIATALKNRS
ncbi:MAG: tetratricopeptide repeat protein [Nibricoccus sp.]